MEPSEGEGAISEAASEMIGPATNFGGIDALAEALERSLTPVEREKGPINWREPTSPSS
jgi:hypothetical protein